MRFRCDRRAAFALLFWFSLVLFFSLSAVALARQPSPIRVRLLSSQSHLQIDGFALRVNGANLAATNLPIHSRLKIFREDDHWTIATHSGRMWYAHGPRLEVAGEMIKMRHQMQPPGVFVLDALHGIRGDSARFDVIARLRADVYLKGVLPSEMPLTWPDAALEAQAVASISYARAQAFRNKKNDFDVDSSVDDQVFHWASYTHSSAKARQKLARVLAVTRHHILYGKNGRPYLAYFDSDCGGVTELAQNVWGRPGNRKRNKKIVRHFASHGIVYDTYCLLNPHNRWHYFVTKAQIRKLVRAQHHNFHGQVRDVKVVSRSPSGRAYQIEIFSTDGRSLLMLSQNFRKLIGYGRIRSTLFNIQHIDDGLEFDGRGFGHGVGMCQHGARFMALNGATYQQILSRYYPEAHLKNSQKSLPVAPIIAASN